MAKGRLDLDVGGWLHIERVADITLDVVINFIKDLPQPPNRTLSLDP